MPKIHTKIGHGIKKGIQLGRNTNYSRIGCLHKRPHEHESPNRSSPTAITLIFKATFCAGMQGKIPLLYTIRYVDMLVLS